jgi:tetratricopeptide (TPR) repeat protein
LPPNFAASKKHDLVFVSVEDFAAENHTNRPKPFMKVMKTIKFLLAALLALVFVFYNACSRRAPLPPSTAGSKINFCGSANAALDAPPGRDGRITPLFKGLNNISYRITTKSPLAQKYFNQGLLLAYGFNHAEAARSFQEAANQDSECAMAYWGLAWTLGPNYNFGMDKTVLPRALDAISKAKACMHKASAKEQALVSALEKRYPPNPETDPRPYYEAFAEAMRILMAQYPDDVEITIITAEALMDLHPWDLWQKDGAPQPWTPEIMSLVDKAYAQKEDHPQALHLAMHAYETSPFPEKALAKADRLRFLTPGAGHLTHMPSHLYINTGHYHEGALANERAVRIDSQYVESCHEAGVYPLLLYPHNYHFLTACAALEGRGARALSASLHMKNHIVDQKKLSDPALRATLQHFYSIPWYIMVKYAMWDKLLAEPKPADSLPYPQAIWHYGLGMAYAGKGDLRRADDHLKHLDKLETMPVLKEMGIWDLNKAHDIVRIAQAVLRGTLADKKGDFNGAIAQLAKAVEYEDNLMYQEPPDWFFSVRHALGDVYLRAGRYAEAEATYRKDLTRWKENGWALKGLTLALQKQGKNAEAEQVQKRFEAAWKWAEVRLNGSVI